MTTEEETMPQSEKSADEVLIPVPGGPAPGMAEPAGLDPVHDAQAFNRRIDLLAAELGRVQEAFDRAKPVLDAARAWRNTPGPIWTDDSEQRIDEADRTLIAAVDAYDTAQKAPETAPLPRLADEPAEVDHPDADTPTAQRGAEGVDLDEAIEEAVIHYNSLPAWCRTAPMQLESLKAAVRAAAPIIAAQIWDQAIAALRAKADAGGEDWPHFAADYLADTARVDPS